MLEAPPIIASVQPEHNEPQQPHQSEHFRQHFIHPLILAPVEGGEYRSLELRFEECGAVGGRCAGEEGLLLGLLVVEVCAGNQRVFVLEEVGHDGGVGLHDHPLHEEYQSYLIGSIQILRERLERPLCRLEVHRVIMVGHLLLDCVVVKAHEWEQFLAVVIAQWRCILAALLHQNRISLVPHQILVMLLREIGAPQDVVVHAAVLRQAEIRDLLGLGGVAGDHWLFHMFLSLHYLSVFMLVV